MTIRRGVHGHACCAPVRDVDACLDTSGWHYAKETAPLLRAEIDGIRTELHRLRAEVMKLRRVRDAAVECIAEHDRRGYRPDHTQDLRAALDAAMR